MPRIRNSANDPIDFCARCFPCEAEAKETYGDMGDGPDGRGNCFCHEDDHPAYEDTDYTCEECGRLLQAEDN